MWRKREIMKVEKKSSESKNSVELLELVVDLAMEADKSDPIDWGMLAIDEENAYRLIASRIIEDLKGESVVAMSVITHLIVENMVLNLKLNGMKNA
jgi:hypothetical protein